MRRSSPRWVIGVLVAACFAAGFWIVGSWIRGQIGGGPPHVSAKRERMVRMATGESLRVETWHIGEARTGFRSFCKLQLDSEVIGTFSPSYEFCEADDPAALFRLHDRRVLSLGAALLTKLDSSKEWTLWSAFGTDAPSFLSGSIDSGKTIKVASVSVRDGNPNPRVEMRTNAPVTLVLIFDGTEFDLDETVRRNPGFPVAPFPENRQLETFVMRGPNHEDLPYSLVPPPGSHAVRKLLPIGAQWTVTEIGGEQVRIRGAYGNLDTKLCTVYIRRPDGKLLFRETPLGAWSLSVGHTLVRVQPRLPRGAAVKPTEIVDPADAARFAGSPAVVHGLSAAASPDGTLLVLSIPGNVLQTAVFDAEHGVFAGLMADSTRRLAAQRLKFSGDSQWVAALGPEEVIIWDARSRRILATLPGAYRDLAAVGNGAVAVARDEAIEIRDVRDLQAKPRILLPFIGGYLSMPLSLDASADGSVLAAATLKGEVELWKLPKKTSFRTLKVAPDRTSMTIWLSPDGRFLLVWASGLPVSIWDVNTGTRLTSLEDSRYVAGFRTGSGPAEAVAQCGRAVCAYRTDGSVAQQWSRPERANPIDPDGRFLALEDGRIMKRKPDGSADYFLSLVDRTLILPLLPSTPSFDMTVPHFEWISVHPGAFTYSSSENGDEYAYLRYGQYLAPLREFRARYRK